jgi:hypothetical protein
MLVGATANRPNVVGSMRRLESGGGWQKLTDLPDDAPVQAITPIRFSPASISASGRGAFARIHTTAPSSGGTRLWCRLG